MARLLHGQTLFTNLEVLPALMLERGPEPGTAAYTTWMDAIEAGLREMPRPMPVKTVRLTMPKYAWPDPGISQKFLEKVKNRETL